MNSIATLYILSLLLGFCAPLYSSQAPWSFRVHERELLQEKEVQEPKHLMVVFVHGTIVPVFSWSSIWSTVRDFLFKSDDQQNLYRRYMGHLRKKSFYRLQPIGQLGLHEVNQKKGGSVSQRVGYLYEKLSLLLSPEIEGTTLYTFGWHGDLSAKNRRQWGHRLARSLQVAIARKRTEIGDDAKIEVHVVGHSHGGNVILNMVTCPGVEDGGLSIDKLVLLGCPVQSETAQYVFSPLFKKVYNFYSRGDMIQILDMVTTDDPYSRRMFPFTREAKAAKKIIQIELTVNKSEPRHVELWLWGCRYNPIYRKRFPIYPYPLVCFVPALLSLIDEYADKAHHIGVDIANEHNDYSFIVSDLGKTTHLLAHNFTFQARDIHHYAWMAFFES